MINLDVCGPADYSALIDWFPTEAALRDFAGPGVRWPLDRAQIDARLGEPGVQAWTAWQPPVAVPIGHIELLALGPREGRIDRVAIHPDHRGRRLAADLVRAALARARADGCQTVDLLVFAGNRAAVRTYRSAGFADVGAISPSHPTVRRMSLNLLDSIT